ncbi:hypothetical protein APS56_01145 [Pseudalgibacter alginicilyticus]|uniref:Uncharacterized protein n=1 Tax=Pseudalgibacter alginicilyticus TaxID=1736674 RepID=A0A0P0CHQ2_9FLAO|nr:hypothetical protein [Pseudalgibacter alginicilyticus]ALJ03840.1 hypothetical protein APS56_01145 [Pseudalgibacter alginicilyticus]
MKKTLLLILITCTIGILKAENIVTAQYPDKITFKGTEYNLNSNPLEPYFEKHPDKRPQGGMMSTALWRGYIAFFEIIDEQLFLTDIKIEVSDKDSDDDYETKWISAFKQVFPNKEKAKIDWYTGILIIPHGKMVEYVHMGYASTFSKYWLLEIDKGNFNEARKYKNKEFVKFKKRQFEKFEKTEEYKKLYAELKENDEYNDDEFIKSFISDFVINYTTKFLTE